MENITLNPIYISFHHYLLRAQRLFFRWLRRLARNTRPGSYPYVSGDTFRSFADYIHDETTTFDPTKVNLGDTIFVCNGFAHEYMNTLHRKISSPYILIIHNGDRAIDEEFVKKIDDKIISCYAQDVIFAHPRLFPIGIGLENRHYHANGIPYIFNKLINKIKKNPLIKKNRILYRFSIHTNPTERIPALEIFSKNPVMETFIEMLPPPIHLRKLMTYKFVASPPGNSIESCRTWEALELRTIPIVKDFVAYRYFVEIGLPMWIVKDWRELEGLTEDDLEKKYNEMMKNPNWEPTRMDYWIKRIKHDQNIAKSHAN